MNMISVTANYNGVTFQLFTNTANIIIQLSLDLSIDHILSVFGAKNNMAVHFR